MNKQSTKLLKNLTDVVSDFLGENQATEVKTDSIQVSFKKVNISLLEGEMKQNDSSIKIPPICELIGGDCSNRVIVQQVRKTKNKRLKRESKWSKSFKKGFTA